MTQERRRYGFVLERQCSLAKHWMAYHIAGRNFIANQLDNWEEVSASREFLPPNMENIFARQMMVIIFKIFTTLYYLFYQFSINFFI